MSQNELMCYIEQLALPGIVGPKPSNRGATVKSDVLVFSHLDYLSIMYPYPERSPKDRESRLPLPADMFEMAGRDRGVKNWRSSAAMLPAGRFYWNEGEPDKGSYAVFAGDDLALLRARLKMSDDDLLERLLFAATNVTRLDFCINITAGKVGQTREHFEAGKKKSRVRVAWEPDYFLGGCGRTIYFGSKGSKKILRVYDKAAELKLAGKEILNRIELQTRDEPADKLAEVMLQNTILDVGKTAIRDFCDFPELDWYQDALSGALDVPMQLTPRKEGDFMKWLHEQVGPSMVKRLNAGQYHSEMRDWLHSMYEYIRIGEPPTQPD